MSRRNSGKVNIPICVAAVLLFLTLLSTHLCSGLYARYTTTASGSDSARVARFEIEDSLAEMATDLKFNLTPGTTEKGALHISNKSEVAVQFTLTVENMTRNLPLKFTMKDPGGAEIAEEGTSTSDYYVFIVSVPAAGAVEEEYTLYIKWDSQTATLDQCGRVDLIHAALRAEQID